MNSKKQAWAELYQAQALVSFHAETELYVKFEYTIITLLNSSYSGNPRWK